MRLPILRLAFLLALALASAAHAETREQLTQQVRDAENGFAATMAAPFSWLSENVEVLDSGQLAHSSGPVLNAKGERVGTFNSIWRRESDGSWKVVFDNGCDACNCAQAASKASTSSRVEHDR